MELEKYSLGIGDRFGREGAAQLRALQKAEAAGCLIVPVWNKSNREHAIIGSSPDDTRAEADNAVRECAWRNSYFVDADHIGLATVDRFLASGDFFTIDVADFIGQPAAEEDVASFIRGMDGFMGTLNVPGMHAPLKVTREHLTGVARRYLRAVAEAGKVYRHIAERKGAGTFIPEISIDEAEGPQTPAELFIVLAAIAKEGIPIQTIAPKFTGSFLKGVDYVGDISRFAQEFEDDLAVLAYAVASCGLPANVKLSIHSGSDKFSLYPVMHKVFTRCNAGLHLKTAGTTWLEEVIGLAAAGGDGLQLAKELYALALSRYDELARPYLSVIHIDRQRLPAPGQVSSWTSGDYVDALRHDISCERFNPDFRQLIHIGYKVAAEMGTRFTGLLEGCRDSIEANVTLNIFERHIRPLFLGEAGHPLNLQAAGARLRA